MNLHLEQIRIPLILRWPARFPAGMRHAGMVDLRDVPRMVTEAAGTKGQMPGRPVEFRHNETSSCGSPLTDTDIAIADLGQNRWAPGHWQNLQGSLQSVITPRWHLIRTEGKKRELYDWCADPQELNDLSATPEGTTLVKELGKHLTGGPDALHAGNASPREP
jgi:arylsulfatase A-like enzyme